MIAQPQCRVAYSHLLLVYEWDDQRLSVCSGTPKRSHKLVAGVADRLAPVWSGDYARCDSGNGSSVRRPATAAGVNPPSDALYY